MGSSLKEFLEANHFFLCLHEQSFNQLKFLFLLKFKFFLPCFKLLKNLKIYAKVHEDFIRILKFCLHKNLKSFFFNKIMRTLDSLRLDNEFFNWTNDYVIMMRRHRNLYSKSSFRFLL